MAKIALVTGSSRGIGRAVALELAREGYDLCLNYIRCQQEAETVLEEIRALGRRCIAVQADVADPEACRQMVSRAERELGRIDLLVNNAGESFAGLFQDLEDADWDRCVAVNLSGARNMTRAVLPPMISEKAGNIVNISSIWGLRGASCEVAYSCAKAGMVALTRSLALELAPSGIRVNAVAPGCIETDMVRVLGEATVRSLIDETPLGRLGQPEDIAHAVTFLASEKASFITGQVLTVDGGFIG